MYVYRIIAIEVSNITDLNPARFIAHINRNFPKIRKPELTGVRNFERYYGDQDDWMDPEDFSRRGRAAVNRIHTAYRRGFVQLRVKLLDVYA